ncbi:uncharacterized protein LOC120016492 [Tripterygium wilfordii]|uniref:uncharacterized protein LOC120016492 n=1 Tax=Tripterygium wilfordii TaxID=458696 RepID=UPI0018F84F9B|nr:uncharacterized protein LOC120016492 [Tripterygium wilfordii]
MNDFLDDSTVEDYSASESSIGEEPKINAPLLPEEKPIEYPQENGIGEVSEDNVSLLSEGIDFVKFVSAKGSERSNYYFVHCEKSIGVSHQVVSDSCDLNDFPDDSTAEDYSGSGSFAEHNADEIDEEESINAETLSCLTENNTDEPDVDVREKFNFTKTLSDKASEFVKQMSPTYPMVSEGKAEDPIALPKMGEYDSRALMDDINVAQAEEFGMTTHENIPSLDKTPSRGKGIGQNAQFAPDSLPSQFPRPNLSSTKKQTTFPMTTQESKGINKESIDMISCDLEIKKDEMKKEKNVIDKGRKIVLEGESIRSLKKMLKTKLMISESMKDKTPMSPSGRGRSDQPCGSCLRTACLLLTLWRCEVPIDSVSVMDEKAETMRKAHSKWLFFFFG